MAVFSAFAVYFIFWWITLFAILPLGLRTQAEENEVVPGTVESAPAKVKLLRIMVTTTLVSAALYAAWYIVVFQLGFGLDSIPRIVPNFD
ncbi:DUF1467 family protein [Pararhizobium sp.]|uniref:DUF1467 family protein n=1 Tax=Pararhizobium sp. TaxID=1977563 RepID=UPI00271A91D7|nr:DUF1467 family protein [Pararhizobium sp.]MDO9415912.1 DUF1467 family protein [Pararhizobium sp.]